MTDKNLGEIIVILDRSGSMASIAADMAGGFDKFIADQRETPGRTLVSLYQFDDRYECCYSVRDVREVPKLELSPRGSTALLDAVGRTINDVGARLAKTAEAQRPGSVTFMIITDGHENASREFTRAQVRDMVKHQTDRYNWQFLYLGADMTTFDEAQALGIVAQNVGHYTADKIGTHALYNTISRNYSAGRTDQAIGEVFGVNLNNPDAGLTIKPEEPNGK